MGGQEEFLHLGPSSPGSGASSMISAGPCFLPAPMSVPIRQLGVLIIPPTSGASAIRRCIFSGTIESPPLNPIRPQPSPGNLPRRRCSVHADEPASQPRRHQQRITAP